MSTIFLTQQEIFLIKSSSGDPGWIGGGYITAVTAKSPVGDLQKKQILRSYLKQHQIDVSWHSGKNGRIYFGN